MHYLIRIAIAIVTFMIGSGLAGLISPSSNDRSASRRNGCASEKAARPKAPDNGNLDPKWVFFKKNLDWREGVSFTENDDSGAPRKIEYARAEIAVFYPSGKFAFVVGQLYRYAEAKDEIFYDDQRKIGHVYLGTWSRTSPIKIVTVADESHFTPGLEDRPLRDHLEGRWDVGSAEPQVHDVIYENRVPYVHLTNFVSLHKLSSYLEKPATYQYVNAD